MPVRETADALWAPDAGRAAATGLSRFRTWLATEHGLKHAGYDALHRWSVDSFERFWRLWLHYADLTAVTLGTETYRGGLCAQNPAVFFPDATLSLVANCLRRRDQGDALVFRNEAGIYRRLSYQALYGQVARAAAFLRSCGVSRGDRVAGLVANCPEATVFCLASAALGACWTSCSPDFGLQGILERFAQVKPKVMIATTGYQYAGKAIDLTGKLTAVADALTGLEAVVAMPLAQPTQAPLLRHRLVPIHGYDAVLACTPLDEADLFRQHPFNIPLFILYSSGTTGKPKCIVHGAGGLLLKILSEQRLHLDIRPHDRVFYFTTCSWMMWNWQLFALASQATVMLYDGSPFYPEPSALWHYTRNATFFGTSAKYLTSLKDSGYQPSVALPHLRTLASTGSPLSPEAFRWVYRHLKADLHLASISGGTDICSCFFSGVPTAPVHAGECQAPCLGIDAAVTDASGNVLNTGVGELTVSKVFPAMPLAFWNDPGAGKYHQAYFAKLPGRWLHGDFVARTGTGYAILGRSDATLNPGGVRIGTAEIYRHLETMPGISDALAVGVETDDFDVKLVLFVVPADGQRLDDQLRDRIKAILKTRASPRHVPALILEARALPYTRSGKLAELPVKHLIHGRPVLNREALANPEALDQFVNIREIAALRPRISQPNPTEQP